MDIAFLSIALNLAEVKQNAGISVMRMVLDNARTQSADLNLLAEASGKDVEKLGSNIDIKV